MDYLGRFGSEREAMVVRYRMDRSLGTSGNGRRNSNETEGEKKTLEPARFFPGTEQIGGET